MKIKIIIIAILGILFVIASVIAIVNAGKLLSEGFKAVLKYEECNYERSIPAEIDETSEEIIKPDVYCVNNRKRNIAEGLAYLIISLPISLFLYRKLMGLWNN